VGGGVQLGPLGTAATNRPSVPAAGDYDDGEIGEMIGRGNRSTRRKPAPVPPCPPQTPHSCPEANPGRRGGNPATNRLSYGSALNIRIRCIYVECILTYLVLITNGNKDGSSKLHYTVDEHFPPLPKEFATYL
jgi:hypothetical protein